ncbi:GFA family protein [Bosea sp. UNC402CLCol]|uniref:GFA family protein n=1 Tax=Bosea sp. UNC402CLCol TaxID=1510531 RepID=UPI0032C154B9
MKIREARCSCGQLRITCRGEPAIVALCHCRECQRRTGSAYGVAAFFAREAVAVSWDHAYYDALPIAAFASCIISARPAAARSSGSRLTGRR